MPARASCLMNDGHHVTQQLYWNTMVPGVTFNVALLGPTGVAPDEVYFVTSTRPATNDPIFVAWDPALNDTTNDTITLYPDTRVGGDITGGEIFITIKWYAAAGGGI